ncbi:hypothetical protein BLNAU_4959 [Blattamonas nauphoetae]|uniref:Uncharacterized protein n=1 Tax=Blattamonas nauphoetae TaxID=2049346 RepID=A0ABQ9Y8J6_9EUKA|nr:hypothetical protein BLNAU_4959 [Blattamonas nauphoetae]
MCGSYELLFPLTPLRLPPKKTYPKCVIPVPLLARSKMSIAAHNPPGDQSLLLRLPVHFRLFLCQESERQIAQNVEPVAVTEKFAGMMVTPFLFNGTFSVGIIQINDYLFNQFYIAAMFLLVKDFRSLLWNNISHQVPILFTLLNDAVQLDSSLIVSSNHERSWEVKMDFSWLEEIIHLTLDGHQYLESIPLSALYTPFPC